MSEDALESGRLLNASYGANTAHGGGMRTNMAYYENRSITFALTKR